MYRLPKAVTDVLGARINGPLREKLLALGLKTEADTFNIPHVTVVHVHNADPTTSKKMLEALPKVPPVLKIALKDFGFAGNVLREFYRISLEDGSVIDVATGTVMPGLKKQ